MVACPNHIHDIVWDEITYPVPNFNGATIEAWAWMDKQFHPTHYDGSDH